jgi:hypothetical protein
LLNPLRIGVDAIGKGASDGVKRGRGRIVDFDLGIRLDWF